MSEETTTRPAAPAELPYKGTKDFDPVVFEVIVPDGSVGRVLRFHARQMPVHEADAMDDRFVGEPWFEAMADGTGVNGPRGLRANRARLKVVALKVENVEGVDGALEGKALDAFLDAPEQDEVCYAAWTAYQVLSRTARVLFRPFRDPGAGTGGDAGAARGSSA